MCKTNKIGGDGFHDTAVGGANGQSADGWIVGVADIPPRETMVGGTRIKSSREKKAITGRAGTVSRSNVGDGGGDGIGCKNTGGRTIGKKDTGRGRATARTRW